MGKAIIFSAPSGSGKSTLIRYLMKDIQGLEFSISATSRQPRGLETDGKDYYFITPEEFARHAENGDFLEWEEVYAGTCYGTLKSELERIWDKGNTVIFDVDVKGGMNLKSLLGEDAVSIFIRVPSLEILEKRLRDRGTDSEESISKRIAKATIEMTFENRFDRTVVNDDLDTAVKQAEDIIRDFLKD